MQKWWKQYADKFVVVSEARDIRFHAHEHLDDALAHAERWHRKRAPDSTVAIYRNGNRIIEITD